MTPDTLDGKLSQIRARKETEEKEKPPSRTAASKAAAAGSDRSTAGQPASFYEEARDTLGSYLTEDLFPKYDKGAIGTFIRTVAPYVMTLEPEDDSPGGIDCTIATKIDVGTAEIILSALGVDDPGDALAAVGKPALKKAPARASSRKASRGKKAAPTRKPRAQKPATISLTDLAESIIPGSGGWGAIADILSEAYDGDEETTVAPHPYLLAMGMKPEHRPLAVAAMAYGIRKGTLTGWEGEGKEDVLAGLLACVPTLDDFRGAASIYGIEDVKPAIRDLNRVVRLYAKRWGDHDSYVSPSGGPVSSGYGPYGDGW